MDNSTKAALLSAFAYPGVGQIVIGHKIRGWVLVFINSIFMVLLIQETMSQAYLLIDELQKNGTILSLFNISSITSQITNSIDYSSMNKLISLIILAWLISVVDAYILGRKKDKN